MPSAGRAARRPAASSAGKGSDAVKVAVRVRPFNTRELQQGSAKLVVDMGSDNAVTITDPSDHGKRHKFTYDYSFWSHDDFTTADDGLLVPTSARYADQQRVFNELGSDLVDASLEGYNAALFAYGQTGRLGGWEEGEDRVILALHPRSHSRSPKRSSNLVLVSVSFSTGSGKSYSMLGYGVNKGIVPMICEDLFKRIGASSDKTQFQVRRS